MDIKLLGSGQYEYRLIGPTEQELQDLTRRRQGGKQAHRIIVWDLESDKPAEGMRQEMGQVLGNKLSPIVITAGGGFPSVTKPSLYMTAGSKPIPKQVFFEGEALDPNNLPVGLRHTDDVKRTLTAFMSPTGDPQQFIDRRIVKNGVAPDTEQPQATPPAQQPRSNVRVESASPETPLNKNTAGVIPGASGTIYRLVATGPDNSTLTLQAEVPGKAERNNAIFVPAGNAPAGPLVVQEKGFIKPPFDKGEAYVRFPDDSKIDLSQVYNANTGKAMSPAEAQVFSSAVAALNPVGKNLQIARQVDAPAQTEVSVTTSASKHYTLESTSAGILIMRNGSENAGFIIGKKDPAQVDAKAEMALIQYNGNPKGIFEKVTGPVNITFPDGATIDLNVIDPKTGKPVANQEQFRDVISRLEPVGQGLKVTKNTALEGGTPAVASTPTMPEPPKAEPKPEPKPATPAVDPAIVSLRETLQKVKQADTAWKTSAGVPDAKAFDDFFQRADGDPRSLGAAFKSLEELAGKDTWTAADKQAAKKFAAQFEKSTDDLTDNKKLLNNRNRSGSGETDRQLIQELNGIAPDIHKAVDTVTPNYKGAAVTTPHPFEKLVAAHSEPSFPVSDASTGYSAVPGGRRGGISMGA